MLSQCMESRETGKDILFCKFWVTDDILSASNLQFY